MRGKFIVFEGIDGCGKSTQVLQLAKNILGANKHENILLTREPWRSEEIKKMLAQDEDAYSNAERIAKLYVGDRWAHLQKQIIPALKDGVHVISDRYAFSTLAYQQTQGISFSTLAKMHKGFLKPDAVIIVDVLVKDAEKRMHKRKRGSKNEFEKFEKDFKFKEKLRKNYLDLKERFAEDNVFIVDGNQSVEKVSEEIWEGVRGIFDFKHPH